MKQRPLTWMLLLVTLLYGSASLMQNGWPDSYWSLRHELVLLSGVLLMAAMSSAMLLAMRPKWLEKPLGGLDKIYALHKRLGIASGLLLAAHWLIKLSPPLAMALHWAAPRMRHGGGHGQGFSLVGLAKDVGEWTAWAVLAMVLLALLRAVPYRFWRKLHILFAPLYLMGAFHSVILMPGSLWLTPIGMLTAVLLAIGCGAAIWSISGQIGKTRRVNGQITSLARLPGDQLEVVCQLDPQWPGHQPGQFALLTFDAAEGAHPFTIASAQRDNHELRFIIKSLGDYTRMLADKLKVGSKVEVEGPYGCFTPVQSKNHQVWIAGGIGVTPFMAWLEARKQQSGTLAEVDFYYCVARASQAARLDEIQAACAATGVRLHLIESQQGQRLDASMLPEVEQVWFCGPQGFSRALEQGLASRGPRSPRFHTEAFDIR